MLIHLVRVIEVDNMRQFIRLLLLEMRGPITQSIEAGALAVEACAM